MQKFFTFFIRYNSYLLLALYCGIASLFMKLQNDNIVTQLRTIGTEFSAGVNEKLLSYRYILNLKEENDRLIRINTDLLARVLSLETAVVDEQNRKKLLANSALNTSGFSMARVVSRKFSDRENILLINKGRRDGIKKDMTVLTPEGLVGRVSTVSEHFAKVTPVINTDFKVSVISDKSNSMGVLSWNGGKEFIAQVDNIPISSSLKLNEQMITSEFSTFAIRGIPVGRVVSIKPDKLFYTVEVRLAVDFSSLTEVLIAPLKIEPEKIELIGNNSSSETFP
ncbi:MAG: rod shape-determining protein MreC [Chlorobiaceae bacterium]|nr:rod shape-determining protein MreC [Chlorobiaceae bacterium]